MPQRFKQAQPEPDELDRLTARLGRVHVMQRLGIEEDHAVEMFGHGRWLHPENWVSAQQLARWLIRFTGIQQLGRRQARRHEIVEHPVRLMHLSPAAEGLRILHLTDLHLDMAEDTADALTASLAGISADIAVLTGDFRARTHGSIDRMLAMMGRLRPLLPVRCFGVLGNHDCLAMVPALEDLNIRMLLNESLRLDEGIFLVGVDDPHYYQLDNLARAMNDVPLAATVILLAHSPRIFRQAAHARMDLMLCGHTHGGQVCLPGGWAMTYHCDAPRRYCRGAWRYRGMLGYTSRGCGTSILDIRFFCPPEIVVHRLENTDS